MSEIADFLRARIAERRAIAEAAAGKTGSGDWRYKPGDDYVSWVEVDEHATPVNRETWWPLVTEAGSYVGDTLDDEIGNHIAANGPDAVIADLDAKLALVDELEPPLDDDLEPATDAELHALESHPAYEYRTTTGPRKQWADADVPPCGADGEPEPEPGWERNVDAGRDGWERWDYTEESYWRRLRPDGPRPTRIPRGLRILAQPFAGHPDHKGEEWAP